MTLREKQSLFARLIAHLISHIFERGWEVTLGDGHVEAGKGHMPNSNHYIRLAQDLNLFIYGVWITDGMAPEWLELGEFWESLHPLCRWGGRFGGGKAPHEQGGRFTGSDSNHFSMYHNGRA